MNMNYNITNNNSNNNMATLYVGDIDESINEEMLKHHFGQCGLVSSVRLLKNKDTNKNRGFGFVSF
jgi:RNA recognition motif-containing protein